MSVAALAGGAPNPLPMGWIFHIAHCGSTLLARALDRPDANLVLREPFALRQLGLASDAGRLAIVRAMLGKRYEAGLPTIAKANVPVNFILPDLIALGAADKAIFLHCPLRDYLLAVLRTPDHRNWVSFIGEQIGGRIGDLAGLSDAERAAALWLAQMRTFRSAMAAMPGSASLDSELFFADPRAGLSAAALHLEANMPEAVVEETIAGPIFATNAKNPSMAFDNAARIARRAELERAIASEIDAGLDYGERMGARELMLDRPLIRSA